jgi:hypothetical protein
MNAPSASRQEASVPRRNSATARTRPSRTSIGIAATRKPVSLRNRSPPPRVTLPAPTMVQADERPRAARRGIGGAVAEDTVYPPLAAKCVAELPQADQAAHGQRGEEHGSEEREDQPPRPRPRACAPPRESRTDKSATVATVVEMRPESTSTESRWVPSRRRQGWPARSQSAQYPRAGIQTAPTFVSRAAAWRTGRPGRRRG